MLIEALLFFIFSFTCSNEVNFCLNIEDTYYVLSGNNLYFVIAIVDLLFALLYWVLIYLKFQLNNWLLNIHIYSLLIALPLVVYFNYKDSTYDALFSIDDYNSFFRYDRLVIIVLGFIIFIQILFFINIFVSLIKSSRVSSTSKQNE